MWLIKVKREAYMWSHDWNPMMRIRVTYSNLLGAFLFIQWSSFMLHWTFLCGVWVCPIVVCSHCAVLTSAVYILPGIILFSLMEIDDRGWLAWNYILYAGVFAYYRYTCMTATHTHPAVYAFWLCIYWHICMRTLARLHLHEALFSWGGFWRGLEGIEGD